jgi:hypothetical protein
MVFTTVGRELSVGADPEPAACASFGLVVLAAKEHQHVGERFPDGVTVKRVPLTDDYEEPSIDDIKRATAAAEFIAYTMSPFTVSFDIWKKYAPKPLFGGSPDADPLERIKPQKVLVTCEAGENRSLWLAGMALVLAGECDDGECCRKYLQDLRGDRAFANVHMRKLLDRFMPKELKALRSPSVSLMKADTSGTTEGGFSVK